MFRNKQAITYYLLKNWQKFKISLTLKHVARKDNDLPGEHSEAWDVGNVPRRGRLRSQRGTVMIFGLPREAHLLQLGLDAGRDQVGSSFVGASETVRLPNAAPCVSVNSNIRRCSN